MQLTQISCDSPLSLEFGPSSWSDDFNCNKSKGTAPQHLGRVHSFPPHSAETLNGKVGPWFNSCPRRYLPPTFRSPGIYTGRSVPFPMRPIVRVYRDRQDKQGPCPQEVPAWGTAGLHPGDDSTTAGGARQGISGSRNETPSKLKGHWSIRMSNLSTLPAGSQGCGERWGMKGRRESHVAFSLRTYGK